MGYNYCQKCGYSTSSPGSGRMHDPLFPSWMFWKRTTCTNCGGDGFQKPPGWPDESLMKKLRPPSPPAPPKPKI